jgi:hypothetical protein
VVRYAPRDLFALVPQLVDDFEPELRELDRLLDDDVLVQTVKADVARRAPMLEYNDHFNRIPTTREVLSSPEYTRGGEVGRALQQVVAYGQRIPAIVPGYAEILTINGRFPTEVLSGQRSPREALEGAAREIQAVLDKWKGRA